MVMNVVFEPLILGPSCNTALIVNVMVNSLIRYCELVHKADILPKGIQSFLTILIPLPWYSLPGEPSEW